jgi:predicted phage-related endonuclease
MMIYPKSREEWLALRHKYISSTESAALFGLSPYSTAFEVAVLKKEAAPPAEYEENERMTWGLRLQRAIAQGIAEDYGVKVRALSGYATLPAERIGASFDFEIVGLKQADQEDSSAWDCNPVLREHYQEFGPGVLEIKNVDGFIFKQEWAEVDGALEAPAHIEIQVQHQLLAIERSWAAIGALVGGNRIIVFPRRSDPEVAHAIREKIGRFWAGLAAGKMPDITLPQDAEVIRALYHYAEPGKVLDLQGVADSPIVELAAKHAEATKLKSAAEAHHKSTGALLMMGIGDAEKVLLDGYSVNAAQVEAAEVKAYTRQAYRSLRVYPKKQKEAK